jgi:hypothetical protein
MQLINRLGSVQHYVSYTHLYFLSPLHAWQAFPLETVGTNNRWELEGLVAGLWLMAYGLWLMAYGLWLMAYGLWTEV